MNHRDESSAFWGAAARFGMILGLSALIPATAGAAARAPCSDGALLYKPAISTLQGTIDYEDLSGRHDRRNGSPYLILTCPISTRGSPNDPENATSLHGIRRVEIITDDATTLRQGARVEMQGPLIQGLTAHQYKLMIQFPQFRILHAKDSATASPA